MACITSNTGSTTVRLWPAARRPTRTLAVGNPDDWAIAIASGAAVGVTSAATISMHPTPASCTCH